MTPPTSPPVATGGHLRPEPLNQPVPPHRIAGGAFDPGQLVRSLPGAFAKLDPRTMVRSPVMFVVEVGAALTTVFTIVDSSLFGWLVVGWLWLTVLFANLAEAVAEGRGKAQADTLRRARTETEARLLRPGTPGARGAPGADLTEERVAATSLHVGDLVVCEAGDGIPGDGEIVEGIASVDESAITGESAPVIRESGGDRSAVTGGTKVLSDRIVVRITSEPGETFLDRMIALVEGADRRRTPNEIALTILLASLTIIFLLAIVTLQPMAAYSGAEQSIVVLVALLVCLIPTTIGALLSRDRDRRHGPAGAAQRARDVGPRRRGRGRRLHAAARQDRHDHARRPPGCRLRTGRWRTSRRGCAGPPSWPASPTKLPRAARSLSWPRRSSVCGAASSPDRSSSPSRPRPG